MQIAIVYIISLMMILFQSLSELTRQTVPENILTETDLNISPPMSESTITALPSTITTLPSTISLHYLH